MMLAQAIDNLPASFWKYFCMALIALVLVACAVIGAWSQLRKPDPPQRSNDDPPLKREIVSKRFNHDATEQRFGRIETRLDGHDSEIDAAWEEMQRMREENNKTNTSIAVSLARLETHFGLKVNNDKI